MAHINFLPRDGKVVAQVNHEGHVYETVPCANRTKALEQLHEDLSEEFFNTATIEEFLGEADRD